MLASLEERSTHRELGYFLGVGNRNSLDRDNLVDEVTRDVFALFWEAMALLVEKLYLIFKSKT